jgi:hypothetical protein
MIDAKTISLFGCPVSIYKDTFYLNKNEFDFILGQELDGVSDDKIVKTSKNVKILNNIELNRVKNLIDSYAKDYVEKIMSVKNIFYLTHSWIARSKKNEPHHEHCHQSAIFSVVYYIQADKASITFNGDKNFLTRSFNFEFNYTNFNEFNSMTVELPVKSGDILIFPGYVKHSAKNYSDSEKIVLGANYFVKGKIGVYEKTTLLDL